MPESEIANTALGALVLGGHLVFVAIAYQLGLRIGRDRQRVLSSRLGHGFAPPAPSALLFDPEGVTTDFKRRDLGGVCPDCDAAPERCSVSGCRSLSTVGGSLDES